MKGVSLAVLLATILAVLLLPRQVGAAQVTLILRNIATDGFDEWKVASNEEAAQSTGKIGQETAAFEQTWDVSGREIRFWWNRLSGEADATVLVNNIVVFRGHCLHGGAGKVRMIDTCPYPSVYKTDGSGPYLLDKLRSNVTYVAFATSMLPARFYNR